MVKVFPYSITVSHIDLIFPLQTDGGTTTMTTARPLLKYGQLKINHTVLQNPFYGYAASSSFNYL